MIPSAEIDHVSLAKIAKNLWISVVSRVKDVQGGYQLADQAIIAQLEQVIKEDVMQVKSYQQTQETANFTVTMTADDGGYWWINEDSEYSWDCYYDECFEAQIEWTYKGALSDQAVPTKLAVDYASGSQQTEFDWISAQKPKLTTHITHVDNDRLPIDNEFTISIDVDGVVEAVTFAFDFERQEPPQYR